MAIVSAASLAGLFLRMMTYELRRDEQLYVSPARLLDDQAPYRDFFYNHPPGSAWWFYAIRRLLSSDHLLFDARLGVFLAWLAFAAAIAGFAYVLTRSARMGWSVAVLSLVNELFLTQAGMSATNNFLPLPLSFIGLALFMLAAASSEAQPRLVALAGVFLSLAVTVKVSAVAFIMPAAIGACLLHPGWTVRQRLRRTLLPLAAGGIVGGLPILACLARDPARFLAHVVGYHVGPHLLYYRSTAAPDEGAVMTLAGKLALAHGIWIGGMAAPLAALLTVVVLWVRDGGAARRRPDLAVFLLGSFAVGAGFSLLPTPSFPQYFGPALICLPLALVVLTAALSPGRRAQATTVLVAASFVAIAAQAPRLLQSVGTIASPGRWTTMKVHEIGVEIARTLAAAGLEGRVATLAPVYPLEGGLEVYPELATGPFAYRTGDVTAPDLARFYRMTTVSTIGSLLEAEPPAALLLGFSPELEKPMLDFALAHGYAPASGFHLVDRYGTAVLYLRAPR